MPKFTQLGSGDYGVVYQFAYGGDWYTIKFFLRNDDYIQERTNIDTVWRRVIDRGDHLRKDLLAYTCLLEPDKELQIMDDLRESGPPPRRLFKRCSYDKSIVYSSFENPKNLEDFRKDVFKRDLHVSFASYLSLFECVSKSLQTLLAINYPHRDIHERNFVCDGSYQRFKLIDFGVMGEQRGMMEANCADDMHRYMYDSELLRSRLDRHGCFYDKRSMTWFGVRHMFIRLTSTVYPIGISNVRFPEARAIIKACDSVYAKLIYGEIQHAITIRDVCEELGTRAAEQPDMAVRLSAQPKIKRFSKAFLRALYNKYVNPSYSDANYAAAYKRVCGKTDGGKSTGATDVVKAFFRYSLGLTEASASKERALRVVTGTS